MNVVLTPSFVAYSRLIRPPQRVGIRNLSQRSKSRSWRIPRCPVRIPDYSHVYYLSSRKSFRANNARTQRMTSIPLHVTAQKCEILCDIAEYIRYILRVTGV